MPPHVKTAFGARWIFPNDQLPDGQSFVGHESEEGQRLSPIQSYGASAAAWVINARSNPSSGETVALYENFDGKIVANPQRSFGYVYVAAWLKEKEKETL